MTDMTGPVTGEAQGEGGYEPSFAEMEAAAEQEEAQLQQPEADDREAPAREPLPPEEVERRWRQTQGALRNSRADLKALKAELASLRAKAPDPMTPPDPHADPIGAVEWMQGQFMAAQQQQVLSNFVSSIESQEAEVLQSNPDYHDALEFLRLSRRAELVDLGVPEDDVDDAVAQEFISGVAQAHRNGLNPAKVALKLARERGYARRGRLSAIQAGSAAARTLSANGGRGGGDAGSIESRIANLSGAALRDAWRRHKAAMA